MTIPRLVSPDDHIQEPPHVWETRLPARLREHGPRIERLQGRCDLGAGDLTFVETGDGQLGRRLELQRAARSHPADRRCRRPPPRRGRHPAGDLRRDPEGLLRPGGPPGRHGHRRHRRLRLLPQHVRALLRPAVLLRARQGARPGVHPGLERLRGRGVVRRLGRPARPDGDRPPVGRRAGRGGGQAAGRSRLPVDLLPRGPPRDRPAVDPLPGVGPALRRVRRHRDGRLAPHRDGRLPHAGQGRARPPSPTSWPRSTPATR